MGVPILRMVYFMENPFVKRMITRGTRLLGHLEMFNSHSVPDRLPQLESHPNCWMVFHWKIPSINGWLGVLLWNGNPHICPFYLQYVNIGEVLKLKGTQCIRTMSRQQLIAGIQVQGWKKKWRLPETSFLIMCDVQKMRNGWLPHLQYRGIMPTGLYSHSHMLHGAGIFTYKTAWFCSGKCW